MVCEEVVGSNTSSGLPGWAVALIICLVVLIFGGFLVFFLKNRCERGLTFIIGGVLAANLTPPIPRSADAKAIHTKKMDLEAQGQGTAQYPELPTYEEVLNA